MPQVFKALTSISVWILFIHGLVAIAWGGVDMWFLSGGGRLTMMAALSCSIGSVNLLMAAIVARLRQKME